MSRKKTTITAPVIGEDGRAEYKVAPGVAHVAGRKVTTSTIRLTPPEAMYDLALERISPADGKPSLPGEGA